MDTRTHNTCTQQATRPLHCQAHSIHALFCPPYLFMLTPGYPYPPLCDTCELININIVACKRSHIYSFTADATLKIVIIFKCGERKERFFFPFAHHIHMKTVNHKRTHTLYTYSKAHGRESDSSFGPIFFFSKNLECVTCGL